jgi:hypothetical protein
MVHTTTTTRNMMRKSIQGPGSASSSGRLGVTGIAMGGHSEEGRGEKVPELLPLPTVPCLRLEG